MDDSMRNKRRLISTQNVVDMTAAPRTPESQVPYTDQKSQFVVVSSDDMDNSLAAVSLGAYVGPSHATTTIRAIRCDKLYVEPVYGNLGSMNPIDEESGKIIVEIDGTNHDLDFFTDNTETVYKFKWNTVEDVNTVNADTSFSDELGENFFRILRKKLRDIDNSIHPTISLNLPSDGRLRIDTGSAKTFRFKSPHAICGTRGYSVEQLADTTLNPANATYLSPHNPSIASISMCHLQLSGVIENTKIAHQSSLVNTLGTIVVADRYMSHKESGPFPTVQLGTTRRYPGDLRLQLVTCKQRPMSNKTRWIAHLTIFE
jgi:hypothetical protein